MALIYWMAFGSLKQQTGKHRINNLWISKPMKPITHLIVSLAIEWGGLAFAMLTVILAGNTMNASFYGWFALICGFLVSWWLINFVVTSLPDAKCPECGNTCELISKPQVAYKCDKCHFCWKTCVWTDSYTSWRQRRYGTQAHAQERTAASKTERVNYWVHHRVELIVWDMPGKTEIWA